LLISATLLSRLHATVVIPVAASIFQGWRNRPPTGCASSLQLDPTNSTVSNGTIQVKDSVQDGMISLQNDDTSIEERKLHRPERGKLLPDTPNAHDLYDAYKSIQSEYQEKAFHSENQ
jgi:hypothetical protein